MKIMLCRGCNKKKKLVDAHIIPESFFRNLKEDDEHLKLISSTKGFHTKRSRIGIYDKKILCSECEAIFQDVDDYAAKIFINNERYEELKHQGRVFGYRFKDVNYQLLKRFVISILWRASVSNHYFYQKVNLGPFEESAKNLIWAKSPGDRHEFSFVLAKFENNDTLSKTILDPHQERWFGKKYYRFYLGGYVLYVKVDSRETPHEFAHFIPSGDDLIVINRGDIKNSKEFPILLNSVKKV